VYVAGLAVVLDTLTTDQRIRTRKFASRIYRYTRGPRYPGVVPPDVLMPGASWHRDTTWTVVDGSGTSSVSDPRGISWTPLQGGALFVADRANNKAKLIGTFARDVGLLRLDGSETPTGTNFNGPENVAIDGSGGLYVVDRLNRRVLRYDMAGNFVVQVDEEPNADGQSLLDPTAVGVDDSLAYVADMGRGQVIRFKRRP
jgi:DNA-binding beta-propeller fold protein YncE